MGGRRGAWCALALLWSSAAFAGEPPFRGWSLALGLGSESAGLGLRVERHVAGPLSLGLGVGGILPIYGAAVAVRLHTEATRGAYLMASGFAWPTSTATSGGVGLKLGWRVQGDGDFLDLAVGIGRARVRWWFADEVKDAPWFWYPDVTLAVGWNL